MKLNRQLGIADYFPHNGEITVYRVLCRTRKLSAVIIPIPKQTRGNYYECHKENYRGAFD